MPIFLSNTEKQHILTEIKDENSLISTFFHALQKRVYERVSWGNLLGPNARTIWWHSATEYLSDAAMSYALQPTPELATWINKETLEIVRKSTYDWVGPEFRDHSEPFTGHLETAHLCWGVSAVYDLAKGAFSETEQIEIKTILHEKGIVLCRRWLDKNVHLANWRSILFSGAMITAVVLEDEKTVNELLPEFDLCLNALQDDGSYGESLQYGNYLLLAITFAKEAVERKYPQIINQNSSIANRQSSINWFATSMFYAKPFLDGWGDEPRARAANFNDSAAIFRPSGDVLLHIAARGENETEKGLAKWLFEKYYSTVPNQAPHDLATLGMRNDWGFLTLPLLTYPSKSISPEEANLPLTTIFSNGNGFMRDAWEGKTIIATNGGSEPLNGLGYLHGDLNSFILVHNNERLLADPGHSCYRNLIHGLESASQTHNTCTFLIEKESLGLQEDLAKASLLQQKSVFPRRLIISPSPFRERGLGGEAILGNPIDRGDKLLICEKDDIISVIGSEVGKAYGNPIQNFSRFWILAGSSVVFIIDQISADYPVTTLWNWVVNNREGKTVWKILPSPSGRGQGVGLEVHKNNAGMKLFHGGNGSFSYPVHGFLHDAYHPEPNQLGEGRSGDSFVFRFTEKEKLTTRTVVHAIALDEPNSLINWNLSIKDNNYTLKSDTKNWTLKINGDSFSVTSPLTPEGGTKKYYFKNYGKSNK